MRRNPITTISPRPLAPSLYLYVLTLLLPSALMSPAPPPACPEATASTSPAQICQPLIPVKAAGAAIGRMHLRRAVSPFGAMVTEDGRYRYDVRLEIRNLDLDPDLYYLVWAITPDLDQRKKLGLLAQDLTARGQVDWNRFMVVVTVERSADVETWSGPILFSASSPSGKMQTMAGEEILWNNELPVGTRYCMVNAC